MNGLIRVDGLQKRFKDVQALKDTSLHVKENTTHGLIGPNGAGKSTTIKIIAGLMRPDQGTVEVNGTTDGSRRNSLGVVPENPSLHPYHTGRQELRYIAGLRGIPRSERGARIEEVCEQLDLQEMLDRRVSTYSTGTRKRLAIAAALLHRPPILLLDEPMSGLDPLVRRRLKDLIQEIDGTILVSDHDLHSVEEVCDSVTIIKEGRTIVEDRITSLREKMGSLAVEIKLGSSPDRAARALREHDYVLEASADNDSLLVTLQSLDDIPRVVKVAAEYDVVEVQRTSMSLEEIFIKYAEGSL